MTRDPFFKSIYDGLAGKLDPAVFEDCAVDLLRQIHPTIAPIPGGNDAGMDGAIADDKGEAYPLICTTAKDVLRNLTKSLRSYKKNKLPRRIAVLVTSQAITPAERRQLVARATELGFSLTQVYGRLSIARLLYRNPKWCSELLGLSGEPAALSTIPVTDRPLLGIKSVGRQRDLAWLSITCGDRLLVGQPGSGKTFLLHRLARKGGGLFVVDQNRQRIAEYIRAERPSLLIVDDAHVNRDLLLSIQQIRAELKANYSILATCWPGDSDDIRLALGVSKKNIRELRFLTRDQMVKVVTSAGVFGPTRLVGEIVSQADGRPGLAVTLAHMCLQGDFREVVLAEALSASISRTFARLTGQQTTAVLATLSLGGERGMSLDLVAEYLRIDKASLFHIATQLAYGGVLRDVRSSTTNESYFSVTPAVLRCALVRDVFFGKKARLRIDDLLSQIPNKSSAAEVLIGAKARGGKSIPSSLIEGLFPPAMDQHERFSAQSAHWLAAETMYAHLGRVETLWAFARNPRLLTAATSILLEHIPDIAIPRLFENAIGDHRPLSSAPNHSLRQIDDWIHRHEGTIASSMKRRKSLLRAVHNWLSQGRDTGIGLHAACTTLSPSVDFTESDAGSGNKFSIHTGCVAPEEMLQIADLWPRVLMLIRSASISNWTPILSLIREWAHPFLPMANPPTKTMRPFAVRMVTDLVRVAVGHSGLFHKIKQLANNLDIEISSDGISEFDIIFGEDWGDNWKEAEQRRTASILSLALKWAAEDPNIIAQKFTTFAREAREAGINHYRITSICAEIAHRATSRVPWAIAMLNTQATTEIIRPFLLHAAFNAEPGWIELATSCLNRRVVREVVVEAVLVYDSSSSGLIDRILVEDDEHLASCIRNIYSSIHEAHMARLLAHPNSAVAGAAAVQEWNAKVGEIVRDSLRTNWRIAITGSADVGSDHTFKEIFQTDANLAHDWIVARVQASEYKFWSHDYVIDAAIEMLSIEQRRSILRMIRRDSWSTHIISKIITRDVELYRHFMTDATDRRLRLIPLRGEPEQLSPEMIRIALQAKHSARSIIDTIQTGHFSYSGNESAYHKRWEIAFDQLTKDEDPRVNRIGRIGRREAKCGRIRALKRERQRAVYGHW
ncbi:MAG: hypothetical protein ABJE95_15430 [Byssovorax sp.]